MIWLADLFLTICFLDFGLIRNEEVGVVLACPILILWPWLMVIRAKTLTSKEE